MRPPAAKSVTLMAGGYALGLLLGGGHRGPVMDTLGVVVAALLFAAAWWGAWREWKARPARQPGSPFAPWAEEDGVRFSDGPDAPRLGRSSHAVCVGPSDISLCGGLPEFICTRRSGTAMCADCPERGQQP